MWVTDKIKDIRNRHDNAKAAAQVEMYWNTVAKQIEPELIEELPGHLVVNNDTFVECIIPGIPLSRADGWPAGLSPEFQDQLLDVGMAEGCTISISGTFIQIERADSLELLESVMFNNSSNREISSAKNPDGTASQHLEVDKKGYVSDYERIKLGHQKMFHVAYIITIWANDKDTMYRAKSHIQAVLSSHNILKQYPIHRMLETFLASLPFPTTVNFAFTQMLSEYARMLPCTRNPNSNTDDKGLLFGFDTKTRREVVVDLHRLPARHAMLVGPTGSGKTYLLYMLLMRLYNQSGKHDELGNVVEHPIRVILVNPKKDLDTVCESMIEYLNRDKEIATKINIGPGFNNINPLQILYDESLADNGEWESTSMYDYQKILINRFFMTWLGESYSDNMKNYVDKTLNELWNSRGIYRENPKTWKNANWPVFSDLRDLWDRDVSNKTRDFITADAMLNKTYIIGKDGMLSYVNKKTDVDISKDFMVLDISNILDENFQNGMNVFLTGVMAMRFKADTKRETVIALDEASVFFKNPELVEFILKLITRGRSFKIALWMATQQMVDLKKSEILEEVMTNIFINIILGKNLTEDTIKYVKSYFNLSDDDTSNLINADVGEGVIKIDGDSTPVTFKSTSLEHSIFKGTYQEKTSTDIAIVAVPEVIGIAKDNQFYSDDWIIGNSLEVMPLHGYEPLKAQNPVGAGKVRVWVKEGLVINNKIKNQSFDHYATVCILAGYLARKGFDIEINHWVDVDIIARKDDFTLAIEYERPGSHNENELVKKKKRAEKLHGVVLFVGQSSNIKLLSSVGTAVQRGTDLIEYIDRIIQE